MAWLLKYKIGWVSTIISAYLYSSDTHWNYILAAVAQCNMFWPLLYIVNCSIKVSILWLRIAILVASYVCTLGSLLLANTVIAQRNAHTTLLCENRCLLLPSTDRQKAWPHAGVGGTWVAAGSGRRTFPRGEFSRGSERRNLPLQGRHATKPRL